MARYVDLDQLGSWYCNPDVFPEGNKLYAYWWDQVIRLLEKAPSCDIRNHEKRKTVCIRKMTSDCNVAKVRRSTMKIYKNPWASHECYFVKCGPARSYRNEASKSGGYDIILTEKGWVIRKAEYYNMTIKEMPLICESRETLQSLIAKTVLDHALNCIDGAKMLTEEVD